jgi:Abnormal spindle-like microcephaly-assoc'd, ASPM-SPD-2-Hydin
MNRLGSPLRPVYWSLLLLSLSAISDASFTYKPFSVPSSNFGSVAVGSSLIVPVAVTNNGSATVTISQVTTSGSSFKFVGPTLPITLQANQSAQLSVSFAPSAAGAASGSLTVAFWYSWCPKCKGFGHSGSVTGALAGTGAGGPGYLTAPGSVSFGSIAVGSSQSKTLTLSNTGAQSLTISAANVTGPGFTVSGLTLPYSLAAGSSANLTVQFSPTSPGTDTASLAIASNASDSSVAVALSGSASSTSGTLGVTPGSISFGNVTIGTTQTQSGSVTANGAGLTLSSVGSSSSAFTIGGLTLPVTLAAGQSVPFTVTFSPTAAGAVSANISFVASNSTKTSETASGSGATIAHKVDLSWNASTSTSVAGYNVYRATSATGSYSRINPALNPSMNYSDTTVQSGQTYYYATTAVDSSGVESTYSNQVQVAVPFP